VTLRNKEVLGDPSPTGPQRQPVARLRPAPVSWGLLAVCVVMFLLQRQLSSAVPAPDGSGRLMALPWGALYGPALRSGQWWRLLTYAIEHGGPMHLLFNASAIWSLGTALERMVGSWRFFLISVGSTLGCAVFALFAHPEGILLGSSGAILGWTAALLPILNAQGRRSLAWMLAQVAVISLLPGVSLAGHLGGFLFGLPFGLTLRFAPKRFAQVAPLLLFASAVISVLASNPTRLE
jgi:rhomboid protease GluP